MNTSVAGCILCLAFTFIACIANGQVKTKAQAKQKPVIQKTDSVQPKQKEVIQKPGSSEPKQKQAVKKESKQPIQKETVQKTGKTNPDVSIQNNYKPVKLPANAGTIKPATGITKTFGKGEIVFNGVNSLNPGKAVASLKAKQDAINDLLSMGCTLLPGNNYGVFCTHANQFDKAFDYLKKGSIDDVQGESSPQTNVLVTETEDNSASLAITKTPTLYINKNSGAAKLTGTAEFTLRFTIPVLGKASTPCRSDFPGLTEDQYNRKLIDQQNYIVQTRNWGLWSYGVSNDDGVVKGSIEVSDVDIIRAFNYANSHNAWGQTFSLTLLAKAGPTFIYHNPVCEETHTDNSGLLSIHKKNEYKVTDPSLLLRPYKNVQIQMQVVADQ